MVSWTRVASAVAASALFLGLGASPAQAFPSFSNLYVFGDSLVDAGSIFALTGGATPSPSLGYCQGRFTNCPVAPGAPINLADVVNQAIEGTNSASFIFGGDNYAFGGARANNITPIPGPGVVDIPDLGFQVVAYLQRVAEGTAQAEPNALYMINIGGNDVRDIVLNDLTGAARQSYLDGARNALDGVLGILQGYGLSNFLVVGPGDVGSIPEILALGGAASAAGRAASEDLSAAFAQVAQQRGAYFFDTIALGDAIAADPTLFGLPANLDLTTPCLLAGVPSPGGAPVCDDYAFFDPVHPTTQVHQVLGNEILAAVPEPGTAALVVLGLVGIAARRRRR